MPPLNLEDWASVIGIAGAALGGLTGLVKLWIINPLSGKIDELNGNFSSLNNALAKSQSDWIIKSLKTVLIVMTLRWLHTQNKFTHYLTRTKERTIE